jgi:hypothetical protein
LDAEGWFEVGLESEWQSHARLNAGELRSVEYRVLRTDPGSSARGSLVIKGYLDDTDIEFALHYRLLWKVGSSIALVALCIWFGLGFRRRLKARRADI